MKLNLKFFIALCFGAALIYTGCKKLNDPSTADPILAPQVVAAQVAANMDQTLFGGLGAFDVSGGLGAPSTVALNQNGRLLNRSRLQKTVRPSLASAYCGSGIDTTVNYSISTHDTTATISGSIKFTFTCSNGILNGYTTNDNLAIAFSIPTLALTYKIGENFALVSQDPTDPNANFSLTGTLSSNGSYRFKTGTQRSGTEIFNYTLTSMVISPLTGDIISGSASFTTSGSGPKGVWSYKGTITFLGNHQATVVIGGKSYNVTV